MQHDHQRMTNAVQLNVTQYDLTERKKRSVLLSGWICESLTSTIQLVHEARLPSALITCSDDVWVRVHR